MTDTDIIKAFDILDKFEFFGGQRAGRLLWYNKPQDVQNKDIGKFLRDVDFLKCFINHQKDEIEAYKHYYNECLKDLKNAHIDVYRNVIEQLDAEIESSDKYIREYDGGELQIAFNKGLRAACSTVKEMQRGNL